MGHFGVGQITRTFVDTSRSTPAWGSQPEKPSRTLVTTILYPTAPSSSTNPVPNAAPDRSGGRYPLIVFAHGLNSAPGVYISLLQRWASAGYVVAAPLFPLTSVFTPGGPDAGDVVNQPKDVSYVIGSMLADSRSPTGTLAGLIDPTEVGVAGHSNGAVTILGLIANSCCHDPRVKAAVAMAGTTVGFPSGKYDFRHTPPLLLVHGTADGAIPYRSAPIIYNKVYGPKGLLTIAGGNHAAAAGLVPSSSNSVVRTTTDFFDIYLRGATSEIARMKKDARSRTTSLHFDGVPGSTGSPIRIPPAPAVHLKASVTPNRNLVNGQAVTVRWSGYTPGQLINVLQCYTSRSAPAGPSSCDFSNAHILKPDPTGSGSLKLQVVTGKVGNGTCGPQSHGCAVVVNNASSTSPSQSRILPIKFARS